MTIIPIINLKASVVFRAGELPVVPPNTPWFILSLDGLEITVKVSAKAARKLATHPGGVVLQGKLVMQEGRLCLLDAGFNWLDAKPATEETAPSEAVTTGTTDTSG